MKEKDKELKKTLDALAARYETADFVKDDPVSFPRRFYERGDINNTEVAALLCSVLAWGNRKAIMADCRRLIDVYMRGDPYGFIMACEALDEDAPVHRTIKGGDINYFCVGLRHLLANYSCLADMARYMGNPVMFAERLRYEMAMVNGKRYTIHFPDPTKSAAKRVHLMLRWLVRRDSPVDMGIWPLSRTGLMMPVDVHVKHTAESLGLTWRRALDARYVADLTYRLQEFDVDDPVKYDFALFGYGINKGKK